MTQRVFKPYNNNNQTPQNNAFGAIVVQF